MTQTAVRPRWKSVVYGGGVGLAWFVYAWLGLRLIHGYHTMLEAELGLAGALGVEIAAASLGAVVLAALLRGGLGAWQQALTIIVWMALIVIGHHVAVMENMSAREFLYRTGMGDGIGGLVVISGIYAVLLAIPFVPGIEIGLLIIALYGPLGAVAVFLATNLALLAGYSVGRLTRALPVARAKLEGILGEPEAALTHGRKHGVIARLARLWPQLDRYRYVLIGLLLNLPGNAIVGGGGGIAFLSGLSGRFAWGWYTLTILIATCPLPVLAVLGVLTMDRLK